MNKLFIIGNGFDLAHGYPTTYQNFINWIWKKSIEEPDSFQLFIEYDIQFLQIIRDYIILRKKNIYTEETPEINCYSGLINFTKLYYKNLTRNYDYNEISFGYNKYFSFNNKFFESLSKKYPEAKWSDIESHFYEKLLSVLEGNDIHYKNDVDKLNQDIGQVKEYFEKYLNENIKYIEGNKNRHFLNLLIYKPMYLKNNSDSSVLKYFDEFPMALHEKLKKHDNILIEAENNDCTFTREEDIPKTLILDFNYTETVSKYISDFKQGNYKFRNHIYGNITHIHIHGKLNNVLNPINLGFGDEMDDNYKLLEKKGDNRFLKYIKSFMYSDNANYRRLLNWINTNEFQLHILGHSCGLSDRIMLNTIFEHNNCKSIKLHYYEWKGGDDFTDKVQNISRHFNKKALMRDKIVPKSLCKPLGDLSKQ